MSIPHKHGPTHCTVCGKLLAAGRFGLDLWGNIFCEKHRHEYANCMACHRLVCPRLTGGGVTYPDQRVICNLCRRTAVDTKEQAKPLVEHLAGWLHQIGVRFEGLILRIDLKDAQKIRSARGGFRGKPPAAQGHLLGYIRKVLQRRGRQERRIVDGVTILSGLPQELFEGTVAHELGHAWLYLAKVDNLQPWQEEGFCNLLSYVLHSQRQSEESAYYIRQLERDPSPVYGEGFRRIHALFKKHGFGEAINYTFYKRRFPPE